MKLNSSLFIKVIMLVLLSALLNNCSNTEKRKGLETYVKQIKSRAIKEIEPLPEVKPYETFTYSDSDLRNPFVPSMPEEVAKKTLDDNGIHPDKHRRKEPLESFPIDSLRMVGTLEKDGKKWALVVDSDGTVHRITKGNYVGQNDGHIDDISEDKVSITEIIADPNGGWREKKAYMALKEEEKPKQRAKPKSN